MLPDRVSNPGPLTYESGALPIALRGPPKNVIWSLNSISLPNKVSFCNDYMFIFLLENIMALLRS